MRILGVIVCLLAAACRQEGGNAVNGTAGPAEIAPDPVMVQTTTLTGLYESSGNPPTQLCITERGSVARFGLVTRERGGTGCSGAGTAIRSGATLRLNMAGESACTIAAQIGDHGRVAFPATLPRGCAYYCRPGAGAGGLVLAKTGGTREAALHARDLAGGPLCT